MQRRGRQARVLLECFADQRRVGVELCLPRLPPHLCLRVLDGPFDGAVMDAELGGNRVNLPLFGVVQAANRRAEVSSITATSRRGESAGCDALVTTFADASPRSDR